MRKERKPLVVLSPNDFGEVPVKARSDLARLQAAQLPNLGASQPGYNWPAIAAVVALFAGMVWHMFWAVHHAYLEGRLEAENEHLKEEVDRLKDEQASSFNFDFSAIDFGASGPSLVFGLGIFGALAALHGVLAMSRNAASLIIGLGAIVVSVFLASSS